MRINSYTDCRRIYEEIGRWEKEFDRIRKQKISTYPFSVMTEGVFDELDMAAEWLLINVGAQDVAWTEIWYYKIDYNYGFNEYFFLNEKDSLKFEAAVPGFYAEIEPGKRWRTEGNRNVIDL